MKVWPVQDAKAHFSEFLDACLSDGPQMVTRRGAEAAVLVPIAEWHRLQAAAKPSLKELLLFDTARTEYLVPPRGTARRRVVRGRDDRGDRKAASPNRSDPQRGRLHALRRRPS